MRVTQVYRREGSEWRLVHRHADPLVNGISLEQAAAIVRSGVRAVEDGGFDAAAEAAADFLTSTTTSWHQCSAGPLSNPSSRPRVAANCRSWCQASQSARVFHVPTITRRSGL